MEDTLGVMTILNVTTLSQVLILVLMEDTLGVIIYNYGKKECYRS